eukprot:TRINITY_DN63737_c0_g1_i1.p1 TRINITY_DN63737_c0_g1~~TRINITY_DN63737_c0_g1_i1.p1  ORF type:complete len:654 (+),score=177.71 TRINITY_DN63737_c0_g1_i1:105-1964(+)
MAEQWMTMLMGGGSPKGEPDPSETEVAAQDRTPVEAEAVEETGEVEADTNMEEEPVEQEDGAEENGADVAEEEEGAEGVCEDVEAEAEAEVEAEIEAEEEVEAEAGVEEEGDADGEEVLPNDDLRCEFSGALDEFPDEPSGTTEAQTEPVAAVSDTGKTKVVIKIAKTRPVGKALTGGKGNGVAGKANGATGGKAAGKTKGSVGGKVGGKANGAAGAKSVGKKGTTVTKGGKDGKAAVSGKNGTKGTGTGCKLSGKGVVSGKANGKASGKATGTKAGAVSNGTSKSVGKGASTKTEEEPEPKTEVEEAPPTKKIYVGELPKKTDEESFEKHFASFGKILEVKLKYDSEGKFRGHGFVTFLKASTAKAVIDNYYENYFNGTWVEVKPVAVKIDETETKKRPLQNGASVPAKKPKTSQPDIVAYDKEGRQYDTKTVIVNMANVGASYGKKVLNRPSEKGNLFDWEGVRRCVRHLRNEKGYKCIGVLNENFTASDCNSSRKKLMPDDIRRMCESVEEVPRVTGKHHGSVDDEMTIKCAYRRNCRFLDNDNYRDWLQQLRDEKIRNWLNYCQDFLQMRYFFDSGVGTFDVLEGNIPEWLLAPDETNKRKKVEKWELWSMSRGK